MENNLDKLKKLIESRRNDITTIRQYDELFHEFSRFKLKEVVIQINQEFDKSGIEETLKLFYDDPYGVTRKGDYYVLVQFFIGKNRFDFFLDNTRYYPAIKFEGLEFSAKVKISYKLQNEEKYKEIREVNINKLTIDEISNILIDFIERVYAR